MVATLKLTIRQNDLPRLLRAAPETVDRLLGALATEGARYAQANMTTSPSAPGEFPGVDTGTLKNSIRAMPVAPLHWLLVDGTDYGVHLEFGRRDGRLAPRPFFGPTSTYLEGQIPSFFDEFLP